MSGTIRQWGSNYLADSMLEKYLEDGFHKYHPNVKFENNLGSTFIGIAGLYAKRAELAPTGRRALGARGVEAGDADERAAEGVRGRDVGVIFVKAVCEVLLQRAVGEVIGSALPDASAE